MSLVEYASEKAVEDIHKALARHTTAKLDESSHTREYNGDQLVSSTVTMGVDAPTSGLVLDKLVKKTYTASVKILGTEHTLTATQSTSNYVAPPALVMPALYSFPTLPISSPVRTASRLIVILPDQQAPYVHWKLHELVLSWLEENRPQGMVLSGDLVDFPSLGTYDWEPDLDPDPINSAQKGVDCAVRLMTEYVQAAGEDCTLRELVEGNHEYRWKRYLAKHAAAIYGIRVPGENEPLLSLPRLLRCKELGFTYRAGYPDAHVLLAPKLGVYHGWVANGKSGATALSTIEALDMSAFVGHTHRQGIVFRTSNPPDGERIHVGCETGCLCAKSPGSKDIANWQRGFATVVVHEDGSFSPPELATYANGTLRWRGQRYWRDAIGVKKSV